VEITQATIVDFLRNQKKPVYLKQILKAFNLDKKEDKKLVRRLLRKLQKNKIVLYKNGGYILKREIQEKENLIKGKVEAHESGFGFLIREDGEPDLFIPPIEMKIFI
jgi:Exoribonuclease R